MKYTEFICNKMHTLRKNVLHCQVIKESKDHSQASSLVKLT